MKLYRTLLFLSVGLAAIFLVWHPTSSPPATVPHATAVFTGSVGETFDHDTRISIDHDPHGEANRAYFSYSGKPLGAMLVTSPPPHDVAPHIMRDTIIEATKKDYGATSVTPTSLTNRNGCRFEHFSSDAHHDGKSYRYELYLHEEKPLMPSIKDTYFRQMLGMHKFEFIIPLEDVAEVAPLIDALIDSFRIVRRP